MWDQLEPELSNNTPFSNERGIVGLNDDSTIWIAALSPMNLTFTLYDLEN